MTTFRILGAAACLAASIPPAFAHHEASGSRQYLAFWSGSQAPSAAPDRTVCLEGRYWEKAFVSIYEQGPEISEVR